MAVIDGNPWFLGMDVIAILGIDNPRNAYKRLADKDKSYAPRTSIGMAPGRPLTLISEAGLYTLIGRSDKPEARKFQDWVYGTVLPALRKDGAYINGEEKLATGGMDENEFIARALIAVQKKLERTEAERDRCASKPKSGVDATFPAA